MTDKSWEFKKLRKSGIRTVEITVELKDDHLYAIADDDYYYGDLTKEESLDLARAVLAKFDPPSFSGSIEPIGAVSQSSIEDFEAALARFPVGAHARVVDGAMCGIDGFIVGTVREDGYVILRCRDGISLQPPRFVRVGP